MPHKAMDKKGDKAESKAERAAKSFVRKSSIAHDPGGSYAGRPKEKGEKPVQDADDL